MIKSIYYFEDQAKLIIRSINNKRNKQIKYTYYEIPYSLYKQIDALYKKNFEGKIWKLLQNCKYEKQEVPL